ncbi:SBBP repeat-containing protein, partial [Candidatus Bipolaricaulota bacterium]
MLVLLSCGLTMAHTAVALESPQPVQFIAGGHVLGFSDDGVFVVGGDHMLRVAFGAARGVAPVSDQPPSSDDQAEPLGEVTYPNLWPGVSVIYQQPAGGIVKSTYHLDPGADADQIRLAYNVPVHLDDGGRLSFEFETGMMSESAPVAWQEIDGRRVSVEVSFRLISEREVGFAVGAYNPAYSLVIDPTLTWNTFLGSSSSDNGNGIAVDASGNVYVTGTSGGTWGSPVNAYSGDTEAFAAKLSSSGDLIWNTFLGSSDWDGGEGIAVDTSGNVYVAGYSKATWGSPVSAHAGTYADAFVAKLNNSGELQWNTFLGSSQEDMGNAIAVDTSGNIYVIGYSRATWGSPVRAYSGSNDVFAAKLSSSGTLIWHTFLGSSTGDYGYGGVAVDGSGNVYVTGDSYATWGSPVNAFSGASDAFVAKLNNSGELQWNTFLGSSDYDGGADIAVDASGNVHVAGYSHADWGGTPVNVFSGDVDAFVAKLLTVDGTLTWHTFMGSSGEDKGRGIAADTGGNVYVSGYSTATWGSPVNAHAGYFDAFAAKLNTSGALQWNAFLGSSSYDEGNAIAVDGSGNVCVTGDSSVSWGSPVNAYSGGVSDVFVAVLADDPAGFFDDVESGVNGWTATGLWGISEQACCPLPMPSPTHAWCFGTNGGLAGAGQLTSPVIDVSGLTLAEVGFWYCLGLVDFRSRLNAQA